MYFTAALKTKHCAVIALALCSAFSVCRAEEFFLDENRISYDEEFADESDEPAPMISDLKKDARPFIGGGWSLFSRSRYYNKSESSDSNSKRDYFYNRLNIKRKSGNSAAEAGAVMYRKSFQPAIDAGNFSRYFLKKYFISAQSGAFGSVIAGTYKMSFGQGLMFYDSLGEFVRPVKKNPRGAVADMGTNRQNYLNGAVWNARFGQLGAYLFFSDKKLSGTLSAETVDEDLYSLRSASDELLSRREIEEFNSFSERLYGGRFYTDNGTVKTGITAYRAGYNPSVNPSKSEGYYSHVYRGTGLDAAGVDAAYDYKWFYFSAEAAVSRAYGAGRHHSGSAWAVTPIFKMRGYRVFASLYDYSPYYFNRHAQGPSFGGAPPNNEQGFMAGSEYKNTRNRIFVNIKKAASRASNWKLSSLSTSPNEPAENESFFGEYAFKVSRELELYYRRSDSLEEKYIDLDDSDLYDYRQTLRRTSKNTYRATLTRKDARLRLRYDDNAVKIKEKSSATRRDYISGEFKNKFAGCCDVTFRAVFFGPGEAALGVYEPLWDSVYSSSTIGGGSGIRYYISTKFKFGNSVDLWLKYTRTEYDTAMKTSNDARIQFDLAL